MHECDLYFRFIKNLLRKCKYAEAHLEEESQKILEEIRNKRRNYQGDMNHLVMSTALSFSREPSGRLLSERERVLERERQIEREREREKATFSYL